MALARRLLLLLSALAASGTTACRFDADGFGPGGGLADANDDNVDAPRAVDDSGLPPGPDAPPGPPDARSTMIDASTCGPARDTDPACGGAVMATVKGDALGMYSTSGGTEAWLLLHVAESQMPMHDLSASLVLVSPPGVDFDLYVYCTACGSAVATSSTYPEGVDDEVIIGRVDGGGDSSFDALVEIRYAAGALGPDTCGDWTLAITGDAAPGSVTCL